MTTTIINTHKASPPSEESTIANVLTAKYKINSIKFKLIGNPSASATKKDHL